MKIIVDTGNKYILRKAFEEAMNYKFQGYDNQTYDVYIPEIGYISLTGKEIKNMTYTYIDKYASEEEKDTYNNYVTFLQRCYDCYLKIIHNPDEKDKILLESQLHLDDYHLKRYTYKYARAVLNLNTAQIRKNTGQMGAYPQILEKLLYMSDKDQIIEYLQSMFPNDREKLTQLICISFDFLTVYHNDLSKEDKNDTQKLLKTKVRYYLDQLIGANKEARKEQEEVKKAELYEKEQYLASDIIKEFITSKRTIKDYLSEHNITLTVFQRYQAIVEKYNPILYKAFQNRGKIQQKLAFLNFSSTTRDLLYDLLNGINCGKDQTRPFDILDYYLIYHIPLEELSNSIEYEDNIFSKDEYLILKKFISTNMNARPLDINQTLNTNLEINCQKDSRGYPIPGTGRMITLDEKQNVITFLNTHKIPLTTDTYKLALNRYLEDKNFIEQNQSNLKTKHKM